MMASASLPAPEGSICSWILEIWQLKREIHALAWQMACDGMHQEGTPLALMISLIRHKLQSTCQGSLLTDSAP